MMKSIAKRAGLDPSTCWFHRFSARTGTHWLRAKELGGLGRDIAVVKQQLQDLR
jgi:hypothetical protein